MLHQWAPLNPINTRATSQNATKETPEQRESRLRVQYQRALTLHSNVNLPEAQRILSELADDLSSSSSLLTTSKPSTKRPRNNGQQWERKLRFAVNRNLAQVQYEQKQYAESADTYAKAVSDDPTDFLVWINAAHSASMCGRLHVARRAYETALRMRPGHVLCKTPYAALLQVIPDADEDVDPYVDRSVAEHSQKLLASLQQTKAKCKQQHTDKLPPAEQVELSELTWSNLVDALRVCLKRRMNGTFVNQDYPIGYPISFITPQPPRSKQTDVDDADIQIVSETTKNPLQNRSSSRDDVVEVLSDSSVEEMEHDAQPAQDSGVNSKQSSPSKTPMPIDTNNPSAPSANQLADQAPGSSNENTKQISDALENPVPQEDKDANPAKKPEVRRSSRSRTNAENLAEADRRRTRNETGAMTGTQVDADLIQELLTICKERVKRVDSASPVARKKGNPQDNVDNQEQQDSPGQSTKRKSSWMSIIDEATEALAVYSCVQQFSTKNSGPIDLLHRLLEKLSHMKLAQYSSTLALVWTTLHESIQVHMPSAPEDAALIAECLISSGRKASKAKESRFNEAARILSQVKVPCGSEDTIHSKYLLMRVSWSWALLYEYQGEMQASFNSTELVREFLERLNCLPNEKLSEKAGPELSGFSFQEFQDRVKNRLFRLRGARDLEKAQEELARASKGDIEAAKRTVSILSASVHASIKSLELDQWNDDDLKTDFENAYEREAWEARVDSEVSFEPRLVACGEACSVSSDVVGELMCKAVRLRMGVHYYASHRRKEIEEGVSQPTPSTALSEVNFGEILAQIRQFVLVIRKIVNFLTAGEEFTNAGAAEWSLHKAVHVSCITLISLTKLLISKIPSLKFSCSEDVGGSRKNKRLGFTRCMLAFVRCIRIMETFENGKLAKQPNSHAVTRSMLYTSVLCLRALVARGCCREEGTSGALMKLYRSYLETRLKEMTLNKLDSNRSGGSPKIHQPDDDKAEQKAELNPTPEEDKISDAAAQSEEDSDDYDDTPITEIDSSYEWRNIEVIRHELAQCYQVLYQIPDLESSGPGLSVPGAKWLEEGCRVSKHLGLSFSSGDTPQAAAMDVELCGNVYFLYRKRIFEMFCNRRREGSKVKRLRDLLNRLAEALPQRAPDFVSMIPFTALDGIINEAFNSKEGVYLGAAANVSKLEEEWGKQKAKNETELASGNNGSKSVEYSVLFFELFCLHAMTCMSVYEVDYKKQKSAERRKPLEEAIERVITASNDCAVALRARPWSIGTWILLGRVCLDLADLALDERELALSTFGLSRPEDLRSLTEGERVSTICSRAEACFAFAESLEKDPWAKRASYEQIDVHCSEVYGRAFDGESSSAWCGFGDDGDLFGAYGLTNDTTSRPRLLGESHPEPSLGDRDHRRRAAIQFGLGALFMLRLKETRHFHRRWTSSTFSLRESIAGVGTYPAEVDRLAEHTILRIREAQRLYEIPRSEENAQRRDSDSYGTELMPWRQEHLGLVKMKWYHLLLEAKLLRKVGRPPKDYLPLFHKAYSENKNTRQEQKLPTDLEPLYQLHCARMKVLRFLPDNASAIESLNLLERFPFSAPESIALDEESIKDVEDWVVERKTAVAEDIISAMNFCSKKKSEVPHAEFYFKSIYCKAIVLAEVLKDSRGALEEAGKCFRIDHAFKALDHGLYRGYFYLLWNYRFTDTGLDPSVETERKLVRWRSKVLGFYGRLLKLKGDWRTLAAIIFRLKKRQSEDLPLDGAVLDDFVEAYARTSRNAILTSMEKSIVTDVSAFEESYKRTWSIFVESLRLSFGVRKVKASVYRGEQNETGSERLLTSRRPRCVVVMHTVLRLEHIRWKSALENAQVDITALRELPTQGRLLGCSPLAKKSFMETLRVSSAKFPLDERFQKLLDRRLNELASQPKPRPIVGSISALPANSIQPPVPLQVPSLAAIDPRNQVSADASSARAPR